MDFTLKTYRSLLESLQKNGYTFLPFREFIETNHSLTQSTNQSIIILRHDVDNLKHNSLLFAKIENEFGIRGSYYFRIVPQSFDEKVIQEIAILGHEIGYHYEDIDLVYQHKLFNKSTNQQINTDALIDIAYESFCENLTRLRNIYPVKTICMHGSPRSKYDNKLMWEKYDYKQLGITGEPYLDINWNEFAYLTDTGRKWNGDSASVRDKVNSAYQFNFKTTYDIIKNINTLPDKVMITTHPQRWTDKPIPWIQELLIQNIKNVYKKWFLVKRT